MEDSKALWQSKTFWGAIISVAGKLAAVFGYEVAPDDEQVLAAAVPLLVSVVGDVIAVIGRVTASKKIA